jgi:hypothetical protein
MEGIALAASRYAAIAADYGDVSNFTGIERKTQNGLQRESEPDCKSVTLYSSHRGMNGSLLERIRVPISLRPLWVLFASFADFLCALCG